MSAKRLNKGEVEEPIKKGPVLVVWLVLLLVFLLVTGFLLVRWYLENVEEQTEMVNGGRVLLSGIAVLVLAVFTVVALVNVLGGKAVKPKRKPVTKRKRIRKTT